jgi:ABC-type polysaccharide/polyol phosphate export permease
MNAIAQPLPLPRQLPATPALSAVATLVRRRLQLSLRTPRELLVPLLTPILFALIIAPALREALHTGASYEAYVALGTVGLLIPLNAMLAGLGVIVERDSGAQRELLAAPIPRPLLVAANLLVALAIGGLQVVTLIAAALLRGIEFDAGATGVLWFAAAALLLGIAMYAIAETLASRVPRQEEYTARLPAIAIVPWFIAGSLFPIAALPAALTFLAKLLPLTHALAVMRYGLLGDDSGLHDIWGMTDTTAMAALSVAVVGAFAVALATVAVRSFSRAAIK